MGVKELFNKICVVAALAMLILPFTGKTAAAQAEAPLDIDKINLAIATILQPLVAENPEIDSIGLVLDRNNTDLNRDRLGLRLTTGLTRTSWAPSERTVFATDLVVQATRRASNSGEVVDLELDASLNVETPSIPMLVYTAGIARNLIDCDVQTGDPARDAAAFVCVQLSELQSVPDLAGLGAQMIAVKEGLVRLVNANIASLEQALASASNEAERTALEQKLRSARATLAFVEALTLDPTLADDGSVQELLVRAPQTLDLGVVKLANLSLRVAERQVALSGKVVAEGVLPAADFARYREEIVSTLRGAESNDPGALNRLKEVASIYISLIVGYTNQ